MHLRKLREDDAPLMLEWMHDPSVVGHLHTDFASKTLADARGFIAWSLTNFPEPGMKEAGDLHLAIASDSDECPGTESPRHMQDEYPGTESPRHMQDEYPGTESPRHMQDEYLGTVSLRHIQDGTAEFAITIRKSAMGTGAGWFGMSEILKKGFAEYGLENIFWCVSAANERAVRFYRKHGFEEVGGETPVKVPAEILARYDEPNDFLWFVAKP